MGEGMKKFGGIISNGDCLVLLDEKWCDYIRLNRTSTFSIKDRKQQALMVLLMSGLGVI
jgi:hypothetical protein